MEDYMYPRFPETPLEALGYFYEAWTSDPSKGEPPADVIAILSVNRGVRRYRYTNATQTIDHGTWIDRIGVQWSNGR